MAKRNEQLEARIKALFAILKTGAILAEIKQSIGADALSGGGKLYPARGLPGGAGIRPDEEDIEKHVSIFIPIAKLNAEKREVVGVVLQPEVTDAQGDIIGEEVIEKAAGDFLAGFNKSTVLGFMHKEFSKNFELRQSYVAPSDMVIANKTVKKGAWIMVVKVKDDKIWKSVKDGKITGFSIGGKAKAQKLIT